MRWVVMQAVLAVACTRTGGQSSDDGAPLDPTRPMVPPGPAAMDGGTPATDAGRPDAGRPDSGPPPPSDAGAPVFVIDYFPSDVLRPVTVCAAGFTPDATREPQLVAQDAPYVCEGSEGAWGCRCDGEVAGSYAAGCIGALLEACGAAAQPLRGNPGVPPSDCAGRYPGRAGRCEPLASGGFACSCEALPGEQLTIEATTCERALWAACAEPCGDEHGTCTPVDGEAPGHYSCDCPYNGLVHAVSARDCTSALIAGCNPAMETESACNGYGGYCDRTDRTTLSCSCADGSQHEQVYAQGERRAACRSALEQACGQGELPDGALCVSEGNGYSARCTHTFIEDTPVYSCECVLHGTWRDRVGLVEEFFEQTCEASLQMKCPETAPVDAQDRARACDQLTGCDKFMEYTGLSREACLENAPDVCVACVVAELDRIPRGDNGCPDGNVQCSEACDVLVPRATAVAACETIATDLVGLSDRERCLCDRCQPTYNPCVLDPACHDLLECFAAQGCVGAACASDPVCGPLVDMHWPLQSLTVALAMSECPALPECAALDDGG